MKLNFPAKITHTFIHNRPLSILFFLGIIFAGLFGYFQTPKQYNPEVTLPAFQITIPFSGATTEEVENYITKEIEGKIADIEGVDKIYSRSIDGGVAILNVEFFVGENLEESKVKIQSKISSNLDLKIGSIGTPLIKNITPDDVPILTFGFTSDFLSQNQIRTKVLDIMNILKKIPDTANLNVHGGEKRALRILIDPAKMKFRKVSVIDIQNAIVLNNIKVPAGNIKDGKSLHRIEVDGTFLNKEKAANILILPGIKLADVASIEDSFSEKSSYIQIRDKVSSKNTVFLSIAKRKGSNAVTVADTVKIKLEGLMQKENNSTLQWKNYRNDGEVAKRAINNLGSNLLSSILIVTIVLFFFLGLKPAIVVAITIPLTLALVFLAGYFSGQTINRITLFSLILSLGLLVDSATVVVENIYRHLSLHENRKHAIVQAVNEVGIGLFLSTLTSVIVFLPTSQISGMMGEYMGPLSFFVPMALIFSMIVAYKTTPFLADILLEKSSKIQCNKRGLFDKIALQYATILEKILSTKKRQIHFLITIFTLLIIVLTFPILQIVHFRMLPSADKEQFYIYLDMPEGTDLEKTKEISDQIQIITLQNPEVTSIQSFVGSPPVIDFNGLYKSAHLRIAPHLASLRVNLRLPNKRNISSSKIVEEIRNKLQKKFPRNIHIRFVEDPPGPPVTATLVAKVQGTDQKIREEFAHYVYKYFQKTKGVVDSDTSIEHAFIKTTFSVDHEKALMSGVSSAQIAETLRTAISGSKISEYHLKNMNEMAFIEIQFPKSERDEIQDLSKIYIKSMSGEMVPINSIVKKQTQGTPSTLYNDKRQPSTYVSAEIQNRSVVYAVIDLMKQFIASAPEKIGDHKIINTKWDLYTITYTLENGEDYTIAWGGEWEMTLNNFRDLGLAMIVAFILIYAVLVAQFQSFVTSALIMITIPLAFIGILPGFAILDLWNGTFLTSTSLIGFITLMGIVVNNAILYVEYVEQLIKSGINKTEALIKAGKTRLRPILLTSLTTVLGSLTIVNDPVWSGFAWAIVFGLSLSALLTLGVFPVLYNLIKK